jgi:signal transduction histidine kinase
MREPEEERRFSEQLMALHEVSNQLSRAASLDELCRAAVELGQSRLGFDRLGIWFACDDRTAARGTFGVDESGQIRDERESRVTITPQSLAGQILRARKPVLLEGEGPVRDNRADVVGRGMHAIAALWNGEEVIGFVSIDNLLRQQPITERQCRLLALYASALGHLWAVKRLESELRQRAQELAEADEQKDQFLAMLAHELRNPLAPIRNATYLLKQLGPAETRLERAREIIDRQVGYLARQLDDLLDVSRITRGRIELRPERLDLVRLVRDVVEDTRGVIAEAGLTLTLELPEEPIWLAGDPTRLAQIVGNLLGNAAKFTPPGGAVGVQAFRRSGVQDQTTLPLNAEYAVVTVTDTGIGIEPEMLPRVFETFAQADRTLDRSRGGLGLGLALVKGLVELHGGQVGARSAGTGHGAEFTVLLPLASVPAVAEESPRRFGSPGPLRVLIVEDNHDAAETLRDVLELTGLTVAVAWSGSEAVETARQFVPDVVLCDLGLPGMNGYEVAAALRQDPVTAAVRLIAITGYGQEEDKRRASAAGFDLHLTKPVDLDELQGVLTEK